MLRTYLGYFLLVLLLLTTVCDKSVDNNPQEPSSGGTWHYTLPTISTITTDTLNIWLDVNNDQTYRLELIERDNKLLYSSIGTWEETSDSIVLTGSNCRILDTSTEPDSIVPLEDSLCEAPISLELPKEEDTWTIKTANLTTLLTAFPIPADAFDLILAFLPEIILEKERD